jgi:hypothetical protein
MRVLSLCMEVFIYSRDGDLLHGKGRGESQEAMPRCIQDRRLVARLLGSRLDGSNTLVQCTA